MRPEEIALRMRGVTGLQTVVASRIVQQLSQMGCEPHRVLHELGLNERQQTQFNQLDPGYLSASLRWLELPAHRMLNYGAAGYPERLAQIDDAPLFLLIEGDPQALSHPQLAMVGSRQFSHYGERWAHHFAEELARCGFTITSGLAIGIDGICHRAALAAGVARLRCWAAGWAISIRAGTAGSRSR